MQSTTPLSRLGSFSRYELRSANLMMRSTDILRPKTFFSSQTFVKPNRSIVAQRICQHRLQANKRRFYSTEANSNTEKSKAQSNLQKVDETKKAPLVVTVVEGTKDVGYGFFGILGLGMAGAVVYWIGTMIFDTASPQAIFSNVCDIIKNDDEVAHLLGPGVVCYGNERKGSEINAYTYTSSQGDEYLRVIFYVEGANNGAVVTANSRKSSGRLHTLSMIVTSTGEKLVYTKDKKFIRKYH